MRVGHDAGGTRCGWEQLFGQGLDPIRPPLIASSDVLEEIAVPEAAVQEMAVQEMAVQEVVRERIATEIQCPFVRASHETRRSSFRAAADLGDLVGSASRTSDLGLRVGDGDRGTVGDRVLLVRAPHHAVGL